MPDVYAGREQTKAKHFILKHYLQRLAFKILTFRDVTFVDGFSGPWECATEDFADSSFKIAIAVLRDAQDKVHRQTHIRRRVRCFFSETDPVAYRQLVEAVSPYHRPADRFEIRTSAGRFEDAVGDIEAFVGPSFPLVFVDPTGWTGYPFDKIKLLFDRPKCEVLVNFMYDHVNRFARSQDPAIVASLDPILGGPGWRERLDRSLPIGLAVERLFRETLAAKCGFKFVVSTKIDKSLADRPHFFIAYGTNSYAGLREFREVEFAALREHSKDRAEARGRKRDIRAGMVDLFSDEAPSDITDIVTRQVDLARADVLARCGQEPTSFRSLASDLMQTFLIRETNVKDICVRLAKEGVIYRTWDGHKPGDADLIRFVADVPKA